MDTDAYPEFPPECSSLLRRHLNRAVFARLCSKVTANGWTLARTIRSGVVNPDSRVGVYAGDAESYTLFAELFDPIIAAYHGFAPGDRHPGRLPVPGKRPGDPDPHNAFILSSRIRVARNLAGLPLGAALSRDQRRSVENRCVTALQSLNGSLAGDYYPLATLGSQRRRELIDAHLLFKGEDRFLEAAGLLRDWPDGRGIYYNREKTFLVWINEEDQLRIISMQDGGDLGEVYRRLCRGLELLGDRLDFLQDERLGFISSCPTNLGSGLRASVHVRLPRLSRDPQLLHDIARDHHLQIRGLHGEHSANQGGIYDISNRRRLGVDEAQCLDDLESGLAALLAHERR